MKEADLRAGDLSPIGKQQHRDIAERMFKSFPDVFKGNQSVCLRSTVALRCNMSMIAFGDKLKSLNPNLQMDYDTGAKFMTYMNYMSPEGKLFKDTETGPWVEEFSKFKEAHYHPNRLIETLFNNSDFVSQNVNPINLMSGLYSIASDMQDVATNVSFYDLFTSDELYEMWKVDNLKMLHSTCKLCRWKWSHSCRREKTAYKYTDCADDVIKNGGKVADLRFGHDGNISPLFALMHINDFAVSISDFNEVHKHWRNYKVVPMATNLQMIFFRNKKDPTIFS